VARHHGAVAAQEEAKRFASNRNELSRAERYAVEFGEVRMSLSRCVPVGDAPPKPHAQ